MKKRKLGIRLVLLAILIGLFAGLVWAVVASGVYYWNMQPDDGAWVTCYESYVQVDFTQAPPRATPTVVGYPGPYPPPQFQTQVFIKCHPVEQSLQSIRQRTYFPAMHNE